MGVKLKRFAVRGSQIIGGLLGVSALAIACSAALTKLPGEGVFVGGLPQNSSHYVKMHDGVNIAVEIWLPNSYQKGAKLPTAIRATRYWRAMNYTFVARGLYGLGLLPMPVQDDDIKALLEAGYAVALVDDRGTGASEGHADLVFSPKEVADFREIVDWIIRQPWSNQRVGAFGISYNGHTAEFFASLNHPAVRAVAPQSNFFDLPNDCASPGGLRTIKFLDRWSKLTSALDANDICKGQGLSCKLTAGLMLDGVKPVSGQGGRERLDRIVAGRHNPTIWDSTVNAVFGDDPYGKTSSSWASRSPYAQRAAVEKSNIPMMHLIGWSDCGISNGALSRFMTFSNPQLLVLTPTNHLGKHNTDFLFPDYWDDRPPELSFKQQYQLVARFFDRYVKNGDQTPLKSQVVYYTLGEPGRLRSTPVWPVVSTPQQYHLRADGGLLSNPSPGLSKTEYRVDYSATSGEFSRWHTGLGPRYDNRAEADRKLLVFTSPPFEQSKELVGAPVVDLDIASTAADNAFFVYLEDVAPDGRVTYLTEGVLRGIQRRIIDGPALPYKPVAPFHSQNRRDAMPMIANQRTVVTIPMLSISALIKQGHRLRIALSGNDESFLRFPRDGTVPTWTVFTGAMAQTRATIPLRPVAPAGETPFKAVVRAIDSVVQPTVAAKAE